MTEDRFTVPELTRGLRSFAAPKALGGLHDRYFAPLLGARRSAKAATRWGTRLSALDAGRLEAIIRVTVREFAVERYPDSAPDQRALAAQVDDACTGLFDALRVLGTAQSAVETATDDEVRAIAWAAWTGALHGVFAEADRGWEQVSALLATVPVAQRRSWRRRRAREEN